MKRFRPEIIEVKILFELLMSVVSRLAIMAVWTCTTSVTEPFKKFWDFFVGMSNPWRQHRAGACNQ